MDSPGRLAQGVIVRRSAHFWQKFLFVLLLIAGAYIAGGCNKTTIVHTESFYDLPQADGTVMEVRTLTSKSLNLDGTLDASPQSVQVYIKNADGKWDRLPPMSEKSDRIISMIYHPNTTACSNDRCYDFQPFGNAELGVRPKS